MVVQNDTPLFEDFSSEQKITGGCHGEEIVLRAHQFVSSDLYAIERMLKSGVEPNYASLFGPQAQAKIAALTLLTRQKLLDIHHAVIPSRDMLDARKDTGAIM